MYQSLFHVIYNWYKKKIYKYIKFRLLTLKYQLIKIFYKKKKMENTEEISYSIITFWAYSEEEINSIEGECR